MINKNETNYFRPLTGGIFLVGTLLGGMYVFAHGLANGVAATNKCNAKGGIMIEQPGMKNVCVKNKIIEVLP